MSVIEHQWFSFLFCWFFARINKQERAAKHSRRPAPPKVVKLANEIMLWQGPTEIVDNKRFFYLKSLLVFYVVVFSGVAKDGDIRGGIL